MSNNIARLFIYGSASIGDAMKKLQETGEGILLYVDNENRLKRTITDGDIRRLVLAGFSTNDSIGVLPEKNSVTAEKGTDEISALKIMNEFKVDQLPLLDQQHRPAAIVYRRDIDTRIMLSTPHLGDYEIEYIEEAFHTNWIAPLGPNVDAFEQEMAAYVGSGHAAAVSSGTSAIHLSLVLSGVGPGDIVFCSSLTFVASANPILYQGARPVFIDSDPETWNMSPAALKRALSDADKKGKLPKAVIVVNLYGQSADMDEIIELCDNYGVPVIEDAAESLGATYKGRFSGTLGKIGIYSFNGNKIITTSGGGMLVSDNPEIINRARFLSTQARDSAPHYQHSEIGFNYRMSNVLAGIGRGQLKVLDDRVAARRDVFNRYKNGLSGIDSITWMPEADFGRSTRWLSVCIIDPSKTDVTPGKLIERLRTKNIEARHVWKPMHLQPLFKDCLYYPLEDGSFSDFAFTQGVCLPSGSNLSGPQQERIVDAIIECMNEV